MRHGIAAATAALLLLTACSNDGSAATTTVTVKATTTTTIAATTTLPAPDTTGVDTIPSMDSLPTPAPSPGKGVIEPLSQLGTIEIPKLGVKKPLLEGVTIATLNHGPGHWPGTALPGHMGNVVIGGHRTSHDRPFRHIDQLVPGDQVILTTLEGRYVYRVRGTKIVTPNSLWIIGQSHAYTATLFACHPVGSTSERIVVFLDLQH